MPINLSPDGARYLAIAHGEPGPSPFVYRRLLPFLNRDNAWRWRATSIAGVIGTGIATAFLAHTWQVGLAAGLMVTALPSTRFNLILPVLVDAPALACATGAAALWVHHLYIPAVVLCLISGTIKETAPIFAALFAWTLVLLVGLCSAALIALYVYMFDRVGFDVLNAENAWILAHPIAASRKYHSGQWLDGMVMVAPWGGALAALGNVSWQLVVVLAVAYAQLLIATDSVRLYQWAAPFVCVAACQAVPVSWLPLLVVVTVFNPLGGNGL